MCRIALSLTVFFGCGDVTLAVPRNLPCPILNCGVLYSANWSISGLVTMYWKNVLICPTSAACAPCQAWPQKNVKISTLASSGPFR